MVGAALAGWGDVVDVGAVGAAGLAGVFVAFEGGSSEVGPVGGEWLGASALVAHSDA